MGSRKVSKQARRKPSHKITRVASAKRAPARQAEGESHGKTTLVASAKSVQVRHSQVPGHDYLVLPAAEGSEQCLASLPRGSKITGVTALLEVELMRPLDLHFDAVLVKVPADVNEPCAAVNVEERWFVFECAEPNVNGCVGTTIELYHKDHPWVDVALQVADPGYKARDSSPAAMVVLNSQFPLDLEVNGVKVEEKARSASWVLRACENTKLRVYWKVKEGDSQLQNDCGKSNLASQLACLIGLAVRDATGNVVDGPKFTISNVHLDLYYSFPKIV